MADGLLAVSVFKSKPLFKPRKRSLWEFGRYHVGMRLIDLT